jgi:hypothetical protein
MTFQRNILLSSPSVLSCVALTTLLAIGVYNRDYSNYVIQA